MWTLEYLGNSVLFASFDQDRSGVISLVSKDWLHTYLSVVGNFYFCSNRCCNSFMWSYSRNSCAQTDCIRKLVTVASSIGASGFLRIVHIRFSRKRLLHCIALSKKRSSIRRKVHFDAIIIASTLLLDLLEETLIVEMASCLIYIGRLLFFALVGLQAYSLAPYPAEYKHKDSFYGLVGLGF